MIKLFTTYYHERKAARRGELDACLAVNALAVDRLFILSESFACKPPLNAELRDQPRRQTYDDLIAWANESAQPGDLIILANCDILFPAESLRMMEQHLRPLDAFCLSRWEIGIGGDVTHYAHDYSQDAWCFRGPIRPVHADWPFGVPGCENKFAYQLREAGYVVSNPSHSIRTYHAHASGIRSPTNHRRHRLPPPYFWPKPISLGEWPSGRVVRAPHEIQGGAPK